MKKKYFFLFTMIAMLISSCEPTKKTNSDKIYEAVWQLEYISGTRITFERLFPDKKPEISFDRETNRVVGNGGCNGYSADYKLHGNKLSFGEPGPTTMMFCGDGELQFLKMMQKVDEYNFDAEGKLNLSIGEVPILRFKKSTK